MGGDVPTSSSQTPDGEYLNPHLRMVGDEATDREFENTLTISIHTSVWEVTAIFRGLLEVY